VRLAIPELSLEEFEAIRPGWYSTKILWTDPEKEKYNILACFGFYSGLKGGESNNIKTLAQLIEKYVMEYRAKE